MMKDWAEMMGIEFLHIGENTTVENFEKEIFWNDIAYKLKVNNILRRAVRLASECRQIVRNFLYLKF